MLAGPSRRGPQLVCEYTNMVGAQVKRTDFMHTRRYSFLIPNVRRLRASLACFIYNPRPNIPPCSTVCFSFALPCFLKLHA